MSNCISKICQPRSNLLDEWSDPALDKIYVNDLHDIRETMLIKFLYGKRIGEKTNVIAKRKSRFNRLR